ncbi:MAG: L,D-transpeptidase family protein [Erythrobacter sp.]
MPHEKQTEPRKSMIGRAAFATILASLIGINSGPTQAADWNIDQAQILRAAVLAAPQDALPQLDVRDLDSAMAGGAGAALNESATALALQLAQLHLLGSSSASQKGTWGIRDTDQDVDVAALLERSLSAGELRAFLRGLRPGHPDYAALRAAYASETDAARRRIIARNMERWRWLPRSLGSDYVLVNIPFFEARLWREGSLAGTWPVIVGKTSTPTPIFSARITGVTFNPWWNIPASIVRRNNGRFPANQGYVFSGGQWRQRPGPMNALGQMKLEMANPYNVIMHDTPNRDLFAKEKRAFSNGCVRTGDAIGFVATLLEGRMTRGEVDNAVALGRTATFNLARPLPVYITYFTAAPAPDGSIEVRPDLYRHDARMGDARTSRSAAASEGCEAAG